MPLRIYISTDVIYPEMLRYTLRTILFNKGAECVFVTDAQVADITVGVAAGNDIRVSATFYGPFTSINEKGHVYLEDGGIDYPGTILYHINSIQEHKSKDVDEFGRFKYVNSWQYKLKNVEQNMVQQLIDELIAVTPKLIGLKDRHRPSKFFLTHDIDSVHGAVKEDGFYALKHFKVADMFRLMFNAALAKPDWLNMDRIMKIEDEYGFKSTFYWLLIQDKVNSDYDFKSSKIQQQFKDVSNNGWQNGLHKSMSANSFANEIKIFGSQPLGNRFHYLKFALPEGYSIIEDSGVKLDTSLGFSEVMGFRNSYGLPFMPYNLQRKNVYDFVEVPQLIMDRTFFRERQPVEVIKKRLIDFFESNKHNCIFTINWHNNFFTELKYDGYLQLYRGLLQYFKERGTQCVTQSEIINEYYKPELYR